MSPRDTILGTKVCYEGGTSTSNSTTRTEERGPSSTITSASDTQVQETVVEQGDEGALWNESLVLPGRSPGDVAHNSLHYHGPKGHHTGRTNDKKEDYRSHTTIIFRKKKKNEPVGWKMGTILTILKEILSKRKNLGPNSWFKRQSLTFMILKHRFNPFRVQSGAILGFIFN